MTRNGYMTLLGSASAIAIASVISLGLAMIPAIAQNPGQIIVTSPGGTELVPLQTSGPQSAAISLNNIKTFVNSGGTGGPGSFTTLTASAAVTLSPASANVVLSPTGTGVVTINPATLGTLDDVTVGGTTPAAGTFTALTATGAVALSPASANVVMSPTGTGVVTINPATAGTINNASIGVTTPLAGKFTTLTWTTAAAVGTFGTDSGQTATATVCEDTTTHAMYFGSGTAGICKGTSSMRFKENIGQIAYGLPEVMKLQPVSYYMKPAYGDSHKQLYGLLAEDTAKVMPKGVTEYDAKGDPSSVDYIGLVPVLVKAIQQQQAQIEELKHQLNAR